MTSSPEKPNRRSIRLPGYDYSRNGAYFITVCRGGSRTAPTGRRKPLGRLIGAFKTVSTKRINEKHQTPGDRLWQRNYYERIVRNTDELNRIRRYIIDNPAQWDRDRNNPHAHQPHAKIRNFVEVGI